MQFVSAADFVRSNQGENRLKFDIHRWKYSEFKYYKRKILPNSGHVKSDANLKGDTLRGGHDVRFWIITRGSHGGSS